MHRTLGASDDLTGDSGTHFDRYLTNADLELLELLHQVLPNRPHPCPLPVYVHRNRAEQTEDLYAPDDHERVFAPFGVQPFVEEQAKDQSVEDVLAVRSSANGHSIARTRLT